MQIKKAVSLSLATLVVVVLMIATRKRHQVRKPHQERDEFHFVVKAAEWDLHGTKVCMFFGSGLFRERPRQHEFGFEHRA